MENKKIGPKSVWSAYIVSIHSVAYYCTFKFISKFLEPEIWIGRHSHVISDYNGPKILRFFSIISEKKSKLTRNTERYHLSTNYLFQFFVLWILIMRDVFLLRRVFGPTDGYKSTELFVFPASSISIVEGTTTWWHACIR